MAENGSGTAERKRTRKQRVLVTGATSTIGRQLCEKLLWDKSIARVWGLSRQQRPYYFRDFDPERFTFSTAAPVNERRLSELCQSDEFQRAKIDTIVHLAFQVGRQGTESQANEYNIRGTQNLLDMARETPSVRKFVFLSSAKVYRLPDDEIRTLTEESPLWDGAQEEPYVRDLLEADQMCRSQIGRSKNLKVIILRPTFVIGRNVHSFYQYYLESPLCPRIVGKNPVINMVHSADVIRAMRLAIGADAEGIFNIPGKETKPLKEYIALAGKRTLPVPEMAIEPIWQGVRMTQFNRHPYPFRSLWLRYNCVLSGEKAREQLGYEPDHHVKFEGV